MQDLSDLYPDGPVAALVPTAQNAGGVPSNRDAAQTAPGTPSELVNETDIAQPPYASAVDHTRSTVTDGRETPNTAPYARADGTPWQETDASDDVLGRDRQVIRFGAWNNV